jgi:hypothetical protein
MLGILDLNGQIPVELSVFLNMPVHVNSALNPLFCLFYNSLIRKGYKSLFKLEN